MARSHAKLLASVWADSDWLDLTASAQRMFALLLSQPKLSLAGVLDYMPQRWAAMACDTTVDGVEEAINELDAGRFILLDLTTGELLIRTFARHDIATVSRNANLRKGFWNAWQGIQSPWLREESVRFTPDTLIDEFTPDEALELAAKCWSSQSEPTVRTTGPNPPSEPPAGTSFHLPPSSIHPPKAASNPVVATDAPEGVENPADILALLRETKAIISRSDDPPPF